MQRKMRPEQKDKSGPGTLFGVGLGVSLLRSHKPHMRSASAKVAIAPAGEGRTASAQLDAPPSEAPATLAALRDNIPLGHFACDMKCCSRPLGLSKDRVDLARLA